VFQLNTADVERVADDPIRLARWARWISLSDNLAKEEYRLGEINDSEGKGGGSTFELAVLMSRIMACLA
jgi:hypothetical protein